MAQVSLFLFSKDKNNNLIYDWGPLFSFSRHFTALGSGSDRCGAAFDSWILLNFLMTDRVKSHMDHSDGEQLLHMLKHLGLEVLKNLIAVS